MNSEEIVDIRDHLLEANWELVDGGRWASFGSTNNSINFSLKDTLKRIREKIQRAQDHLKAVEAYLPPEVQEPEVEVIGAPPGALSPPEQENGHNGLSPSCEDDLVIPSRNNGLCPKCNDLEVPF